MATLVARGTGPERLFAGAAEEVAALLDVDTAAIVRFAPDGTATVMGTHQARRSPGERFDPSPGYVVEGVRDTGEPARFDTDDPSAADAPDPVRAEGIRSGLASPIVVRGEVWGAITVASLHVALPADAERRLTDFTDLLAAAVANAQSQASLRALAQEQAALLRLATLVAEGVGSSEIFGAVSNEVERLFGSIASVCRFADDGLGLVAVGVSGTPEIPVGTLWPFEDGMASAEVYRTGRSARRDGLDWSAGSGPVADAGRRIGIASAVASPILLGDRPWGSITVLSTDEPLPAETEERLERFCRLVATAIANADSRSAVAAAQEALKRVVTEQAALRRVATLVAQDAAPAEILAAVSVEVDHLFALDEDSRDVAGVVRFDPGPEHLVVGVSRTLPAVPLGSRWEPVDLFAPTRVLRTGRSARVTESELTSTGGPTADFLLGEGYLSQVASPIVVAGRLWGAISVNSAEVLPPDAEERLEKFTELIAAAIANAESHEALAKLADEQAALRRVATLVARDAPSTEVFDAVATEVAKLLATDITVLGRYDGDGAATAIGSWSSSPGGVPVGTRSTLGGRNVLTLVAETGKPARVDGYGDASGEAADIARRHSWRSSIAAPVVVAGRVWGVMLVATLRPEPFPAAAEERLAAFTDLVGTAVSNASVRAELVASRARIVAAGDDERRRIERNLHDGTQQRLVSLGLAARAAEARLPADSDVRADLARIATGLAAAVEELQEVSRGIHPAILSRGGLAPALETLAGRAALPVEMCIRLPVTLPATVEVAAYYVIAEGLTNVAKHAHASIAHVSAVLAGSQLELEVRDDGVGGADPVRGSGLTGLRDRIEAVGGAIEITSGEAGGTVVLAKIPLDTEDGR